MQVGPLADGTSTAVMQLGARTTRSMELSIVTAEGDKVTLSASSTRAVGYAGATGTADGQTVTAGALTVTGDDDVKVSVEGSLSHAEIVDLQKVIKAFQHAAARGDASKLLQRLSRPDMDTISSVEGSVNVETSVSVAALGA